MILIYKYYLSIQIITMNTYATWFDIFNQVIDIIPKDLLVIGLECDGANSLNTTYLLLRFTELKRNNIKRIAIWRSPIPDNWWPCLNDFELV